MLSNDLIPHKKLSKNEYIQWTIILVLATVQIASIIANWHQIKLNRMQIDELKKKDAKDHPVV